MSWSDVAQAFDTSWESVFRSVKMVVERGLAHRDLLQFFRDFGHERAAALRFACSHMWQP
jgi:hypothetical protein